MRKIKMILKKILPIKIPIKVQFILEYIKSPYNELSIDLQEYIFLDLPHYGNIGDNAIAVSEMELLTRTIGEKASCFYVRDYFKNIKWIKKNISKNSTILLTGGGNMGTEYKYFDYIREMTCFLFKNNKIVLFPQTVDFGDLSKKENQRALHVSQKIYGKHKNFTMFAREKFSYEFMKQHYPKISVKLVPDIALSYQADVKQCEKKNVVSLCLRNDSEGKINKNDVKRISEVIKQKGFSVEYTDTVISERGFVIDSMTVAKQIVNDKIFEFQQSKIVITDRLHGMVLSYLAKTPCIVLPNYNHKVRGVYEWLKDCDYIYYAEKMEDAIRFIDEISKLENIKIDSGNEWDKEFDGLITALRK